MSTMHAFTRDSSDESSASENDFESADYNPRKRRRTGRDNKESAALGVFGSESEDEGQGRRWKKKSNLRRKGMAFVGSGQRVGGDEEEDEEGDVEMDDVEENDEEDERPKGLGLGFGAPRGLGFQGAEQEVTDEEQEDEEEAPRGLGLGFAGTPRGLGFQSPAPGKKINNAPKRSTPLGRDFVPSSATVPVLKSDYENEVETPRISRPSAFSTPVTAGKGGKKTQAASGVNAGSFAARMMAKMGYKEGEGLGKEGTGRSSVIEVTLRPQGVGLGAVKEKSKQEIEEEKRQAKIRGEKYEDSDEERKKRRKKAKASGLESGSGSGMSTPRRAPKPKFKTMDEIQKAAPGLQIPEAFGTILDMTGPSQRLLTSTSGLLTPTNVPETVDQMESKKLARRAQNDLSAYVEEWKGLEESKAYIEMSIVQQQQEIEQEQREFDQMKAFLEIVQSLNQAVSDMQWDPVLEALKTAALVLDSTITEEMSNIAVAAVHPFLRQATEGWQPLEDPKLNGMAPQLYKIRHILGTTPFETRPVTSQDYLLNDGSHRIHAKPTTTYESMIYKILFPKIVSAITQWNVHDPTPLLALFDAWGYGLLPPFVKSQILNQAVVGKLNEAVSSWNPRKKRAHELPHLWLFPWLQYLPAHHADPKSSTGLVSDVKRKFRQLVDSWDFHKGVVPGLSQWKEVLCPTPDVDQWTPLIMNHVLPSMARFLKNEKNFMVDPNDQAPYMTSLQGIFAWKDILKPRVVAEVIVQTVFPMWHNVLHQWLTVVGPNEEIGQWFEWWREEVFPDEIKNQPSIQQEFDKGHDMINQALDLGPKAATLLPAPSAPSAPSARRPILPTPAPITPAKPAPVVQELTFRQKVEDWCIENELHLLPDRGVLHAAGQPLYRITAAGNGKNGTLVYFKGDSLWALGAKDKVEIKIEWEKETARDALLGMAWHNVK